MFLLWCKFQTITLKTKRSCGDPNSTIKCHGRPHRCMMEGKTICPPPLHGGGIKILFPRTEYMHPWHILTNPFNHALSRTNCRQSMRVGIGNMGTNCQANSNSNSHEIITLLGTTKEAERILRSMWSFCKIFIQEIFFINAVFADIAKF